MSFRIRQADPSDAEQLARLADAVSSEPEGWLISIAGEWRSAGDERRYLKALRRYAHAAVFVAERDDGEIVGRLSVGRDPHPSSAHVADVGLMVAIAARRQGVGRALLQAAIAWGARPASASSSCTSSRGTRPGSRSTTRSASSARATASGTTVAATAATSTRS